MISTLILTFQEEQNLPRCLRALAWCDDIVVLDSGSTDRTVEIARAHGCRVMHRPFDDFAGQRNHALEHGALRHDWVLHLDADEVITPELRDEMLRRAGTEDVDAYRIPARTVFQGVWLRHAALPSYQVRLGHRDRLRFEQVGHGQRETTPLERIGTMSELMAHHSFDKGLFDWVEKHNRYSTAEARRAVLLSGLDHTERLSLASLRDPMMRFRAAKRIARRLPFRPLLRFIYMYVVRGGFLDGRAGYRYCRLGSLYEYLIVIKMRELRAQRDREGALARRATTGAAASSPMDAR